MPKKETTINELAVMVQKGFLGVGEKIDKLENELKGEMGELKGEMKSLSKRMNVLEYNQEEIKTKLDGLAYRFEIEELRVKFERRIRTLELKAGIKTA